MSPRASAPSSVVARFAAPAGLLREGSRGRPVQITRVALAGHGRAQRLGRQGRQWPRRGRARGSWWFAAVRTAANHHDMKSIRIDARNGHRRRGRFSFLMYAAQVAPRLLMSVVLGFLISTPFVLQIFKPDITSELQKTQAAQREAYFRDLPNNSVYLAVQADKAKLDQLTLLASIGKAPVTPAKDPRIINLQSQLAAAESKAASWREQLDCQLYGTPTTGQTCIPGNGPLARDAQVEYSYWENKVGTIRGEIHALNEASLTAQQASKANAQSQLSGARQALATAQNQLNLQTASVTSSINPRGRSCRVHRIALGCIRRGRPPWPCLSPLSSQFRRVSGKPDP